MSRPHVKRGEEVVVTTGAERGKRGKVISVIGNGERVIVEGLKMFKRHTRKSQQNPNGSIVEREGAMHISNVVSAARYDARPSKSGGVKATT